MNDGNDSAARKLSGLARNRFKPLALKPKLHSPLGDKGNDLLCPKLRCLLHHSLKVLTLQQGGIKNNLPFRLCLNASCLNHRARDGHFCFIPFPVTHHNVFFWPQLQDCRDLMMDLGISESSEKPVTFHMLFEYLLAEPRVDACERHAFSGHRLKGTERGK